MAVKDKYGNNLRRGMRVKDLRPETERGEGTIVGSTGSGNTTFVEWDNGSEETVRGEDLVATDRRFR